MVQLAYKITALLVILVGFDAYAQDTLTIDAIEVERNKKIVKRIGLYDGLQIEDYSIRGFNQVSVFQNSLADFWSAPTDQKCVQGKLKEDAATNNLHLIWNKDQDGCDWVGFGLGWDGWVAKDMAYVLDTLALELNVRSLGKPFTNLPWAFCFEDYAGNQAWLGYNRTFLKAESISNEWTKVQVPLQLFPFNENGVDASNIKQLLVQVFAEGEIEIQSIQLVPFSGKLKKDVVAEQVKSPIQVNGDLSEWKEDFIEIEEDQKFAIRYSADTMYFAFEIKDPTPRQNNKSNGDLWQGDAIEIAFSTNPKADPKRGFYLLSDQHIGINCGPNSYVWDWKKSQVLLQVVHKFMLTETGYTLELAIPVNAFKQMNLQAGMELSIEVALDLGTNAGRQTQLRWNSGFDEGFHLSPAKWGILILN